MLLHTASTSQPQNFKLPLLFFALGCLLVINVLPPRHLPQLMTVRMPSLSPPLRWQRPELCVFHWLFRVSLGGDLPANTPLMGCLLLLVPFPLYP
jgi:hypothetical protein